MEKDGMMKIHIKDNLEINRAALIIIVGLMESLLNKSITIEDAEGALFTPYSYGVFNDLKVNPELLELILDGTELEDIESLVPEELDNEIKKMKDKAVALLSDLPKRKTYEHWLYTEFPPSENDVFVIEHDEDEEYVKPAKADKEDDETVNISKADFEEFQKLRKEKADAERRRQQDAMSFGF